MRFFKFLWSLFVGACLAACAISVVSIAIPLGPLVGPAAACYIIYRYVTR